MPEHETEINETATGEAPSRATSRDGWEEPIEALPRRPRRRLLGKGGNPLALSLLGVLLLACGFIGGVLVEKGQTSSGSSSAGGASGLAARFAALRGGASERGLQHDGLQRRRGIDRRPASADPRAPAPRLHPADRRHGRLPGRKHALCHQLRRQHRQSADLGRHDRDQNREIDRQRHPPRRNRHRHRRHRLKRSGQRRIDQRRRKRRRPLGAVRRRRRAAAPAAGPASAGAGSSGPALFGSGG